jgi:catechol 2,3-dioxygenase-like lactoylglutathione lyase family enzyme
MRLRHLSLATADPASLRGFYAETLGLPTGETADGFVVAVGDSAMEFGRAEPGTEPTYHIAFTVPGGSIDAAAEWLATRADLLTDDGRERFRYEFLDATAVYALDRAGNVLELIARDSRDGTAEPFGPDSLLDIAEVGIVVDDVPAAATRLREQFALQGSPDEEFAYLGGDGGAFVLVSPGRNWYPTDRPAAPAPLTVVAEGGEGVVTFEEGPVSVVGIGER